jgi:ribosomal protein L11 methyltransferase
MQQYYYLEVDLPVEIESDIELNAFEVFKCQGVEEFSVDEPKVDEILGDRSYSGGDLPISVLQEVEQTLKQENSFKKFYFQNEDDSNLFQNYLKIDYAIDSKVLKGRVEDWNEEWKKSYGPIIIDAQFQITPSWEKGRAELDKTRKHVFIYPGMGFGTGGHETTYLCLVLLSEIKKSLPSPLDCLDFGCGSGILGIATRFLTPAHSDLYDIDEDALVNSVQNIEINDLNKDDFRLLLPNEREKISKTYDLVFANILQNVLLLEQVYLANSLNNNGYLILSGLLGGQEQEVIEAINHQNKNIELIKVITKGDWVAVLMQKR